MLRKLLKQEFRATGRILLPLYAALLLVSAAANLSVRVLDGSNVWVLKVLGTLIVVLFGVGITAVCVMTLVLMVNRFRTNLLKDEGYIMFTLPASVHQHIWSKLLVAVVWSFASVLVIMAAGFIMSYEVGYVRDLFTGIREMLQGLSTYYALNGAVILLEGLLAAFAGAASACLLFYAAMAIGHSAANHKVLYSVLSFLGLQFVLQFVSISSLVGLARWGGEVSVEFINGVMTTPVTAAHAALWYAILSAALVAAVLYAVTAYFLKRRLNLE